MDKLNYLTDLFPPEISVADGICKRLNEKELTAIKGDAYTVDKVRNTFYGRVKDVQVKEELRIWLIELYGVDGLKERLEASKKKLAQAESELV